MTTTRTSELGPRGEREHWPAEGLSTQAGDRYDRQRRIAGWSQERLRASHVLVAGAGAIGNATISQLALLGIGKLTIVDMDRIERSNLSRTILFRGEDVGHAKAEVAAARAAEINPDGTFVAITGDLRRDVDPELLREADVILGCLDNLDARLALNRMARRAGRGWIDAAIGPRAAQVSLYGPDGPCFECALPASASRRERARHSCTSGEIQPESRRAPAATVATTATMAATIQVDAAVAVLHRELRTAHPPANPSTPIDGALRKPTPDNVTAGLAPGERVTFSFAELRLSRIRLAEDPDCPTHQDRAANQDCPAHQDLKSPVIAAVAHREE